MQRNQTASCASVVGTLALVALTAMAVSGHAVTAAEAQRRGEPGGPGGFGRAMRGPCGGPHGMTALRQLDLSDLQRQQTQVVREQNADAVRTTGEQIRAARQALQDAVTSDVVDEGTIRSRAADLATLEGDAAVQRAYLHAQVWQLLTPEQQARATEIEAEMKAQREDRRLWMDQRREDRRRQREGEPDA